MEYKLTLNLPFTNFSMKANLLEKEKFFLNFWNSNNIYNKHKKYKRKFILNDGPPYANGKIHIGHAFNKILKDIIVKFKILDNYDVFFIPGWDCHGLPIELNVEKQILKFKYSINYFRYLCKNYAYNQINIQKSSFLKLGIIADWNNYYSTMDKFFELEIISSLKKMFDNNFIYNGSRPVYWCFNCLSALAESEVDYEIKKSSSLFFVFIFKNGKFFNFVKLEFNLLKIYLVVWTTTAWTIPFNEGIALNYEYKYVLIKINNSGYIFGFNTYLNNLIEMGIENYSVLLIFNSFLLSDSFFKHPLYVKKDVRILYSDHVKYDSGSACVHIAPSYGYDDYKVALKYKLDIKNAIDEKGYSFDNVLYFNKLYLTDISILVIKKLKLNKTIIFMSFIDHKYPYCWRHKTELIFRNTNQWFLNINRNSFKKKIFNIINNDINWIPDTGKIKMIGMINDRPDWCISRQRFWGIPLFFFIDNNNNLHYDTLNIFNKIFDLVKLNGCDFWYDDSNLFNLLNIDSNSYIKQNDVLDVWFDSSVVYSYISKLYNLDLPFDLCVEGNDQYRGWFQVSLINCFINYGFAPYKTILAHGFILDKLGRKMSKSLKNVISPDDVILYYGVDILRLWISSVNYYFDVNLSEEILDRVSEAYRKIRNTFRFFLSNLNDFNYNFKNLFLLKIDMWIISKFSILYHDLIDDYTKYKFYNVYKKVYKFFVEDLGSKYFDLIKDRLYIFLSNSIYRLSVQYVFFFLLFNLIKLMSPILSFTSEEVWLYLPIKNFNSVYFSNFNFKFFLLNKIKFSIKDLIFWDKLFYFKYLLNKLLEIFKIEKKVKSFLDIEIKLLCNKYWYKFLKNLDDNLNFFLGISYTKLYLSFNYNFDLKFLFFGVNVYLFESFLLKCERCWNKYELLYSNLKICKKCIFILYYREFKFLVL